LRIDVVSGASIGAVNAVILADGLAEGGPAAARARLERFGRASASPPVPPLRHDMQELIIAPRIQLEQTKASAFICCGQANPTRVQWPAAASRN
jgi:predicted acylesterase/phospholipase RssA